MRTKVFLLATAFMASVSAVFADNYPARMYLIGDGAPQNNWDLTAITSMVTTSPGVYTWTGKLNNGRMKFVPNQDYIPSYGPVNATAPEEGKTELIQDIVAGESYNMEYRADYNMPDKSCNMTEGRYKLTLDLTGEAPILTVEDGTDLSDYPLRPDAIYAVGDATTAGWTIENAIKMAETSDNSGIYKSMLKLAPGKELKFMQTREWNNHMYVSTAANTSINAEGEYDVKYTTSSDEDWKWIFNLEEKYYNVTVDLNTMKLSIALPEIVKPEKLYLIGPAIGGENDWSFYDDQIFVKTENDGVYTWTGDLKQGELKFFTDKDYLATAYGATTDQAAFKEGEQDVMVLGINVDYKFKVSAEQTGNYTLTLDLNNMKLNAVKNGDSGTATNISPEQEISWNITDDHIVCVDANQIEVLAISGTRIASCQGGQLDISNLHAVIYIAILHKNGQKAIHKFIVR